VAAYDRVFFVSVRELVYSTVMDTIGGKQSDPPIDQVAIPLPLPGTVDGPLAADNM
jgi:hypothetical protein